MVGLTLSMLVVAAMMLVLRNLAHSTGTAKVDAQTDDRLVSSLLAAGLTLHEAGFNIPDAKMGTALIVVSDATLTGKKLSGTVATPALSKYTGNLVIWQQKLGEKIQCSGLLAPTGGGLIRLLGPMDCDHASNWASLDWDKEVIAVTPESLPGVSASPMTIIAKEGSKICAPFGISANSGHLQITLSAPSSNSHPLTTVECLGNFIDSTAAPASS